jgi:hypothetical protein
MGSGVATRGWERQNVQVRGDAELQTRQRNNSQLCPWSFYICPPFPRGTPRCLRQGVRSGSYHTPVVRLAKGDRTLAFGQSWTQFPIVSLPSVLL